LLGQALAAVDAYGDPANRLTARAALAAKARAELEGAEPGSDRQLVWARHWLSAADNPEDLAFASSLLDGSAEVPGLAVDTDLRWQIVGVLAAAGTDDEGERIDAEAERDGSDIGARRAAAARAARPTPEAKAEAWDRLMSGGANLALLRATASGFQQWGQDEVLRPYLEPYYANLRRLWDERPIEESLSLAGDLFPHTLVHEETVSRAALAVAGEGTGGASMAGEGTGGASTAEEDLPGPLRRILLEGQDGLERALRARAADHE
jgi:aminopeptidase N